MYSKAPKDFPCLFDLGFHSLSLDDIHKACVDGFPLSESRPVIMSGLREFIDKLKISGIVGKIWIDGSFITQKIDPKDVDLVLIFDGTIYDSGDDKLRSTIDWVNSNLKKALKCDSYVCMQYPKGHPLHEEGLWWYAWYHKRWGFDREDEPKGIVVVCLDGATP
ncbi:DUF6932 family protein [Methylobacterium indicum]|uniref:DUF6932 family protein n=1 Tax=Methylobacterium indicum TaxID=1775910 RepID=UPI002435A7D9|nr:hypothetical protein [Methylobacterium indicum]